MSGKLVIIILIALLVGGYCLAQTDQPSADSQPSSLNIAGQQYSRLDSRRTTPGATGLNLGDELAMQC